MNWIKYPLVMFILIILAVLQNSFFVYIKILGIVPNLVFIAFFILIFFADNHKPDAGFFISVFAGFLLDLFLPFYFGASIILLLTIYLLERIFFHLLVEGSDKFTIFYFAPIFAVSFVSYSTCLYFLSIFFNFNVNIGLDTGLLISVVYNSVIAIIGFYIYKVLIRRDENENQLKLL